MSGTVITEVTIPLLYGQSELESPGIGDTSVNNNNNDQVVHIRKEPVKRPAALSIPVDAPETAHSSHRRYRSAGRCKDFEELKYSEWSPRKISGDIFATSRNSKSALTVSNSNSRMYPSRSPNRKLSESRGVKLPDITIRAASESRSTERSSRKEHKRKQVSYSDKKEGDSSNSTTPSSPPLTSSPVGYTMRHPGYLCVDASAKSVPQPIPTPPFNDAIDITVFLADQRGFKFSLVGGKTLPASSLMTMTANHLGIDRDILQETCALWMVSDLLEVQLKPHHVPFEVHRSWTVLLKRFAHAELDEMEGDDPLLVLKRNVQLSIEREVELQDEYENLTEILYVAAKDEVLRGRYLCKLETSIHLAALQMAIELGPYDPNEHNVDTISEDIPSFFPVQHRHAVRTVHLFGFPVIGCKGLENDILQNYKEASSKHGSNHDRRKAYLDVLRDTPFYGAAFFQGQVERPPAVSLKEIRKMLLAAARPEMEVFVAINRDFVTLIDPAKHEILLVQPLFDCSWRRVDVETPSECNSKRSLPTETDDLPSFLLHFPDESESGVRMAYSDHDQIEQPEKSKLLRVFSRQAVMMEALMSALYAIAVLEAKEVTDIRDEYPESEGETLENRSSGNPLEPESASNLRESESYRILRDASPIRQDDSAAQISEVEDPPRGEGGRKGNLRCRMAISPDVELRSSHSPSKHDPKHDPKLDPYSNHLGRQCRLSSLTFSPTLFPCNLNKLCLATFDAQGKCVDAQGSLRRVLQEA